MSDERMGRADFAVELELLRRRISELESSEAQLIKAERKSSGVAERFRALVEASSDWIWEVDAQGRYTYVSPMVGKLLGYEPEEILGKTAFDLMPVEEAARIAVMIRRHWEAAEPFSGLENYNRRKDGTLILLETSGIPIIDAEGKLLGYRGIDRDITERNQQEKERRNREESFTAFVHTTSEWIWIMNLEGRHTFSNPAVATILGYSPEEITGLDLSFLVHEEDRTAVRQLLDMAIASKKGWSGLVFRWRHKNGRYRFLESTAVPMLGLDGNLTGFQGADRDITERKQIEQNLRGSEERYRQLFSSINDAIFVHRLSPEGLPGRFIEVNDVACQRLGYTREELLRMGPADIDAPEGWALVPQAMSRLLAENHAVWEGVHLHKNGSRIPVEISNHLFDFEGKPTIVATVRDITERKKEEQTRRDLEIRMQRAQKLESLGVLAGGIAHDFNNLLTAILGHASLARADIEPDSQAGASLHEIEMASHRAAELCRQMLAYGGQSQLIMESVDLSRLIDELTPLMSVSISKKARLIRQLGRDLSPVDADPAQMRQVVMNLVINASEAIGEKEGSITVSTRLQQCTESDLRGDFLVETLVAGPYVCLEVNDTGCGMNAETLRRIFDPFYSTKFTGRGLGLAAVLGIIRKHGGTLKVETAPGAGTAFRVFIPAGMKRAAKAGTRPAGVTWRGTGVVLLVDDEPAVRTVAGKMLERGGFKVLLAADGREALDIYRRQADEIRCVILDLKMPRMDGVETFRELRRFRPGVRVILASGYGDHEVMEDFASEGLAGFIAKPYQLQALNAKLVEVLERPE